MKELREAVVNLLDELEKDENGGGLLSRMSLRAASELRLALHRADRRPGEEVWRALVVDWSNRVEDLEARLLEAAERWPDDDVPEFIALAVEGANPPLVPGQPVLEEAESDG